MLMYVSAATSSHAALGCWAPLRSWYQTTPVTHVRGHHLCSLCVCGDADALVVVLAIAAASADCASHHTNFTLNNLIACLIATDILQVGASQGSAWRACCGAAT